MTRRFSAPVEPLVETNVFRQRGRISTDVPDIQEIRPRLPVPVFPEDPGWETLYWMAWEAVWRAIRSPSPGSTLIAPHLSPFPNGTIEMEPTAFVANLSGYAPVAPAPVELLNNFYAAQHEDGFIPGTLDTAGGTDFFDPFDPNSAGPNLLAWVEWRYFRLTGHRERIAAVFPHLLAQHRWRRANRTWRSGLYWTTAYAGGLTNQPRVPGTRYHHNHWAWIDASAQAAVDAAMLQRMAVLLEQPTVAEEIAAEREVLIQKINDEMWNDKALFYQDIGPNDRFSPVKSIAAYWALVDSQLVPKERRSAFIQHLRDSWSFRTEYVLPSLSADSEGYNARTGNGYRGGVWPSLTYMVLRGLGVADQYLLAHKLAANHLEQIVRTYEQTGCFWRSYAPEAIGPGEPGQADETGLTASVIVPMILENILGIAVDWPLRQVTWRRHLERAQGYGVRNLPLGSEGTVDLFGVGDSVRIRSDVPFTLAIHGDQDIIQMAVPAGSFDISLK